MKKYWLYLKYILEHKKNVFKTCWKRGLYIHAFTHDLSKFYPSEFFAYSNWFYGDCGVNTKIYANHEAAINKKDKNKENFEDAWIKHYNGNKHHWNYYDRTELIERNPFLIEGTKSNLKHVPLKMPHKYIMQMICDWEAMSLKFGDSAQDYYLKNYDKIKLHRESRAILEEELGLFPFLYNCPESGCTYMTLEELSKLNK